MIFTAKKSIFSFISMIFMIIISAFNFYLTFLSNTFLLMFAVTVVTIANVKKFTYYYLSEEKVVVRGNFHYMYLDYTDIKDCILMKKKVKLRIKSKQNKEVVYILKPVDTQEFYKRISTAVKKTKNKDEIHEYQE